MILSFYVGFLFSENKLKVDYELEIRDKLEAQNDEFLNRLFYVCENTEPFLIGGHTYICAGLADIKEKPSKNNEYIL